MPSGPPLRATPRRSVKGRVLDAVMRHCTSARFTWYSEAAGVAFIPPRTSCRFRVPETLPWVYAPFTPIDSVCWFVGPGGGAAGPGAGAGAGTGAGAGADALT